MERGQTASNATDDGPLLISEGIVPLKAMIANFPGANLEMAT